MVKTSKVKSNKTTNMVADAAKSASETVTKVASKIPVQAMQKTMEDVAEATVEKTKDIAEATSKKVKSAAKKTVQKTSEAVTNTVKKAVTDGVENRKVYFQFSGNEILEDDLLNKFKVEWCKEHKLSEIKSLNVYYKIDDQNAYFVVNECDTVIINFF